MFWISIFTIEVKIMGSLCALILCYMADILLLDNFIVESKQCNSVYDPGTDANMWAFCSQQMIKKKKTTRVWISVYKHSNLTLTQKTRDFKVNKYNVFIFYVYFIYVYVHTHTHIYWSKHLQKTRKRLLLFDKKRRQRYGLFKILSS